MATARPLPLVDVTSVEVRDAHRLRLTFGTQSPGAPG